MATTEDWYSTVNAEISGLKEHHSLEELKKYRLPRLLKLAKRVAVFSATCQECQSLKPHFERLTADIGAAAPSQQKLRDYQRTINEITGHLKRQHALVVERQYLKRFFSISVSLSLFVILLGIYLVNFGITLLVLGVTLPFSLLRITFSSAMGYFLDRRARKQGRVI